MSILRVLEYYNQEELEYLEEDLTIDFVVILYLSLRLIVIYPIYYGLKLSTNLRVVISISQ